MITKEQIDKIISSYKNIVVGSIGSHSALEICEGAKKEGFKTLVVCEEGREKTYAKYYKTRGNIGIVDDAILLKKFKDIINVQGELRERNVIFIPNRSFEVYVGYDKIENEFLVPIFGNRYLLRAEERSAKTNQYEILEKAEIRTPKRFTSDEIDRLVIVKAGEAKRDYERAFFFASSEKEYVEKTEEMKKKGIISDEGLKNVVIEEYVIGAHFNFNYFYSPLKNEIELLGIDMRRQTNLDGILRLPAPEQEKILRYIRVNNIEVGHVACTIRESLLEKVFKIGEKFVRATKEITPLGVIGPFALQGVITSEEGYEDIVIFDVSLRVPGSPGIFTTPYSKYLFRESVSMGRRIAMEIKIGVEENKLKKILT